MNDELDVHHHGAQWSHPSAPSSPIGIVLVKAQAFLLPKNNPCIYCWSHLRSRAKCSFEKNSYLLYIAQSSSRYELGLLCLESEVKINFCPSTDTTLQRLHPSSNSQLGTLIRFATSIPWRCKWWTLDWVFLLCYGYCWRCWNPTASPPYSILPDRKLLLLPAQSSCYHV